MLHQITNINLSQRIGISQLCLAYNNTFLILCQIRKGQFFTNSDHRVVIHVHSDGSLIQKYEFPESLKIITMINPYQFIAILVSTSTIVVTNLEKKTSIQSHYNRLCKHHFHHCKQNGCISIFMYPETKLFLISQPNYQNGIRKYDNLQYYSTNFNGKAKISSTFDLRQKTSSSPYKDRIYKGNNHSALIYGYFLQNYQNLQVSIHELEINQKYIQPKTRIFKISFPTQTVMADIKFLGKNLLAFIPGQMKSLNKNIWLLDEETRAYWNNQISLGNIQNSEKSCLGQIMGRFIIFQSSEPYRSQVRERWIYDWDQKKVIIKEDYSNYLKLVGQVCSYDPEVIATVQKKTPQTYKIDLRKLIEIKDLFMFMLLFLNQDFDDDLLFDALGILGSIE